MNVLLVEDSPTDRLLAEEAFRTSNVQSNLLTVTDGVEALLFLHKQGRYAGVPTPDLVLLDLQLPRKSGHEVLAEVQADPLLRRIPIIVFSSSDAPDDIERAYAQRVNCYITKPPNFHAYREVVRALEEFWCRLVSLPEVRAEAEGVRAEGNTPAAPDADRDVPGPIRLLIVEDSLTYRLLIGHLLRGGDGEEFQVTETASIESALSLLKQQEFDAILSDVTLPDSSGIETVRRLCAAAPFLPLVVLTSSGDEALGLEMLRAGAQDFLIKRTVSGHAVKRSIRHSVERMRRLCSRLAVKEKG